ncbi:hypothetical protein ACFL0R_04075 [Pseudomonadota bacterium]
MRPSDEELKTALTEIERLRVEEDEDPHHIVSCFLYLYRRDEVLERVLEHAERYLRFGQSEDEHARLRKLLDAIIEERRREAEEEGEYYGL